MNASIAARYLRLLGVSQSKPDFKTLSEIVSAHLTRIPFENISKLYRRKRYGLTGLPDVEMYLDGIERFHFGGTCYANNYYLFSLLRDLGYDEKLCAADMSRPDVHLVVMVTVDGREYLADVGYGAPFFEPIPRDLQQDFEVVLGRDRFVLKPQDAEGRSRVEMYRDGQLKHSYLAKPQARKIEEFADIIAESMRAEATFMNAILLVRHWPPGRSLVLHNLTMIESKGAEYRIRHLGDREELVAEIEKRFEIPSALVRESVGQIPELKSVWD